MSDKRDAFCSRLRAWSTKTCPAYLSKDPRCWIIHGIHYIGGEEDILSEIKGVIF